MWVVSNIWISGDHDTCENDVYGVFDDFEKAAWAVQQRVAHDYSDKYIPCSHHPSHFHAIADSEKCGKPIKMRKVGKYGSTRETPSDFTGQPLYVKRKKGLPHPKLSQPFNDQHEKQACELPYCPLIWKPIERDSCFWKDDNTSGYYLHMHILDNIGCGDRTKRIRGAQANNSTSDGEISNVNHVHQSSSIQQALNHRQKSDESSDFYDPSETESDNEAKVSDNEEGERSDDAVNYEDPSSIWTIIFTRLNRMNTDSLDPDLEGYLR